MKNATIGVTHHRAIAGRVRPLVYMVVLALGTLLAQRAPGQTTPACCVITAVDARQNLASARETSTGRNFEFRSNNPAAITSLRVGAGIYADFRTRQVSLDGKNVFGTIVSTAGAAPGGPSGAPMAPPTGPGLLSPAMKLPIQKFDIVVLSALTLNPASVTGGTQQVIGSIVLAQAAPSGGVTVTLQSSNPGLAALAPSVVVQPGVNTATFIVATQPVSINPNVVPGTVPVTISARIGNADPKTAVLTVLPPTLATLTLNPDTVGSGVPSTGTITITGAAPTGGLVIGLSSQNAAASVPATVTIPAGAASATFPVSTKAVSTITAGPIVASHGVFETRSATLTVTTSVPLASVSVNPNNVLGGAPAVGMVTLGAPAPAGGADVQLSAHMAQGDDPCMPNPVVPATVHVAAGTTTATFPINSQPVAPVGWYFYITGIYGSSQAYTPLIVDGVHVASITVPPSVTGGTTVQVTVTLATPYVGCAGPLLISNSNTTVAQAPATVAIPPGATSVTFPVPTSAIPQSTAVTLKAYFLVDSARAQQATVTLTP